jgi:hypothetical protein
MTMTFDFVMPVLLEVKPICIEMVSMMMGRGTLKSIVEKLTVT